MRLLVTRPEPDATRQAEALAAQGHEPVLAPLLRIEPTNDARLELEGAQTLIVTSRNALRALATRPELPLALRLPLFAVGDATAKAAGELCFAKVTAAGGTGAALAELIRQSLSPGDGALVHLSGESIAFDLKSALEPYGFRLRRHVLYRAVPAPEMPAEALSLLRSGKLDGVLLMSPRTATVFAGLVTRHGAVTQAEQLNCYCLSLAVAQALDSLKSRVRVAAHPREEDILALVDSEAASS